MKFKLLIVTILLTSCSANYTQIKNKTPFNSKGFAYIYNEQDFNDKLITGKLESSKMQVSINKLKTNSLVKIINPKTKDYLVIKNTKRIAYPDFYKILITEKVAEKLNIDFNLPLVEISEIKKNKSFIAKKAKIFKEEKKISSNAPVTSVTISNISKNKVSNKKVRLDEMYILIASFYSKDTAEFLKKRIIKELPNYDIKKLKIKKESSKKTNLISGPYNAINFMKNDYSLLKKFGFEDLDIVVNE